MKRAIFISGIGTDVGKTLISSIVVSALRADYWKPIQAGGLEHSDSDWIRAHVSAFTPVIHPEAFRLTQAMSPHAAAERDGLSINISKISVPYTSNLLVIEGAGGVMVPLNDTELMLDFIKIVGAPVLLVAQIYLGSINHTLLSLQALRARDIPMLGIIFNGAANPDTERFIERHSACAILGRIPHIPRITPAVILEHSAIILPSLSQALSHDSD